MVRRNNNDNINNQTDTTATGAGGVPERTATHAYRAKDGLWYRTYQLMADANRSANERRLKELELDRYRPVTTSQRSRSAVVAATRRRRRPPTKTDSPPAERRSKRLRREPAAPPSSASLPEEELPPKKKKKKKKKPRRGPMTPDDDAYKPLNEADRRTLRRRYAAVDDDDDDDALSSSWLRDMETYLIRVEDLSEQNYRNVLRQVEKLLRGTGITYRHWAPDVSFGTGRPVDPTTCDCRTLLAEACDFEDEHGRDLGNGWLLRHPIKKIYNFQRYLLEEEEEEDKGK